MSYDTLDIKGGTIDIELDVTGGGGGGGTRDYNRLINQPRVNDEVLEGNKTSHDLHLQDEMECATVQEIESILYLDI